MLISFASAPIRERFQPPGSNSENPIAARWNRQRETFCMRVDLDTRSSRHHSAHGGGACLRGKVRRRLPYASRVYFVRRTQALTSKTKYRRDAYATVSGPPSADCICVGCLSGHLGSHNIFLGKLGPS